MGKHVPNRQDMCPDCKTHPAISDLFNKSSLKGTLQTLLGEFGHVGGGQIALRFPGDHTGGQSFFLLLFLFCCDLWIC